MKKIVTLFLMLGAVLSMNAKGMYPEIKGVEKHQLIQMMPGMNHVDKVFPYTQEEAQKLWEEAQLRKDDIGMPQAPGRFFTLDPITSFEIDGASFEYSSYSLYGFFTIYMYSIYGASDEAVLSASIDMSWDEIEKTGTFELADFDTVMFALIDGSDTVAVTIQDFSITVSEEEDGSMIGVANITDSEGNVYEVTLRYIIPDPKDTVVVYFDSMQGMYYDGYGFMVAAMKTDYAIQVLVNSETLEGEFSNQDIVKDYSGLVHIVGTDSTLLDAYSINMVGEKNLAEDSIMLTINYFAKDSIIYECHMGYKIPALTGDTINVVVAASQADDSYVSSYGIFVVVGQPADASQVAVMYFYPTDSLTGSYTEEDLYSGYAYFGVFAGTDTTWYDIKSAAFTITSAGTDTYLMAGEYICYPEDDPSSLVVFNLSMPFEYSTSGGGDYSYDATTNFSYTYNQGTDEVSWNTDYFSQYGEVYLEVDAADGSNYAIIAFASTSATIPAGVYNIASTGTGTYVIASAGYDSSYQYDYPSYVATVSGQYIADTWYFISGTVTVSATQIVIAAVNSNSKTINITINLSGSGVEEVEAVKEIKAEKVLNNGILNIKRNGHVYDAMGAKLK